LYTCDVEMWARRWVMHVIWRFERGAEIFTTWTWFERSAEIFTTWTWFERGADLCMSYGDVNVALRYSCSVVVWTQRYAWSVKVCAQVLILIHLKIWSWHPICFQTVLFPTYLFPRCEVVILWLTIVKYCQWTRQHSTSRAVKLMPVTMKKKDWTNVVCLRFQSINSPSHSLQTRNYNLWQCVFNARRLRYKACVFLVII